MRDINFLRRLLKQIGGRFDEYGEPVFPETPAGKRAEKAWKDYQAKWPNRGGL